MPEFPRSFVVEAFDRGFVEAVSCTAADWLAHGDKLTWRPGWTDECGRCGGDGKAHGSDRPFEWSGPDTYPGPCPARCNKGRVHRPCPPMAQPVEVVRLTTRAEPVNEFALRCSTEDGSWAREGGWWWSDRWPGIKFVLPPAGV